LWQVLALLYKGQGRPDLSLAIYLQLQLPSVFDFIQVWLAVASLKMCCKRALGLVAATPLTATILVLEYVLWTLHFEGKPL
jgi:hypothetical protein